MSRIVVKVTMRLLSDTIFASGNSVPGGEDIALRLDSEGKPFLPGSTLKGLLRESLENYLCWIGETPDVLGQLLGTPGREGCESFRRVIFSDLKPDTEDDGDWFSSRSFTALEEGIAKPQTLRTAACLKSGLSFSGIGLCEEGDFAWICDGLKGIKWAGLLRNRGFGHVSVTAQKQSVLAALPGVSCASTLRYRLRAVTPVCIPWLRRSGAAFGDERNFTESHSYIPGSSMRGMVLSALAQQDAQWFEENKNTLLRNVTFHNALPMDKGHSVIPTPMGFYDEKNGTSPYSVLLRDVEPGHKRVPLGQFCYTENGKIHGSSPKMVSALRISREERQMFTLRAMAPGTELEGFISLPDPLLAARISGAFQEYIWVGAYRYGGFGLCEVTLLDAAQPDTSGYGYGETDQIPTRLHMLLLSPGSMSVGGEPAGLDETALARLLGVEQVKIGRSASSVTEMAGFNRTWGCAAPAVAMYEAGSIFTLECSEAPSWSRLHGLEEQGLGIRRNEGCGRVLFFKDFAGRFAGHALAEGELFIPSAESRARQARIRFLLTPLKTGLSTSQLGELQTICREKTVDEVEAYFRHNMEKKGSWIAREYEKLYGILQPVWSVPLAQTLQEEACLDSMKDRLRLISAWISASRKGGDEA